MTQDLIDAATNLADLLTQQNAALKRLDFAAAMALSGAKEAALHQVTKSCPAAPVA